MIHQCSACKQRYLVSDYFRLCDICGAMAQQQIERLYESDDAIEWWRLVLMVTYGELNDEGESPRWQVY